MTRRKLGVASALCALALLLAVAWSDAARFTLGGALVNAGYRLQDPIEPPAGATPRTVLRDLVSQNDLAARVRELFPRSVRHPRAALVVCMDARLDTTELVGDTRRTYYVLRSAGSVMAEREQEMLELAVANGVTLIVLTTHTECAAEHVASDPALRARYPEIAAAVDEREARREELLRRPAIASRLAEGTLEIVRMRIETASGRLLPERF